MAYTPEQLQALQQLSNQRDSLSPEQQSLLDQHLKAAQAGSTALTTVMGTEEPTGPVTGPSLKEFATDVAPLVIGGGVPYAAGRGVRAVLSQAAPAVRRLAELGGEVGGSVVGEMQLQRMGLTPPSEEGLYEAGVAPLLGGVVAKGLQHLPGMEKLEQNIVAGQLRQLPQKIDTGPVPSELVYTALRQTNPYLQVPGHQTLAASRTLLQEQAAIPEKRLQSKVVQDLAAEVQDSLFQRNGAYTLPEAQARLKAVREMVRSSTEGSPEHTAYKLLARSAAQDLDDVAKSVGGDAAKSLMYANGLYRKELAQADLAYVIEKKGLEPLEGSLKRIKPRTILKWMDDPDQDYWRKSVGDKALKEMKTWLENAPELKMDLGGVALGTFKRAALIAGGGAVAGSALHGLGMGADKTAVGAAAGAYVTSKMLDLVSWGVTSKLGRKVMEPLIKESGGVLTPQVLESLAAAFAAEARGNVTRYNQPDTNISLDQLRLNQP
jgi:hypothetical protein